MGPKMKPAASVSSFSCWQIGLIAMLCVLKSTKLRIMNVPELCCRGCEGDLNRAIKFTLLLTMVNKVTRYVAAC